MNAEPLVTIVVTPRERYSVARRAACAHAGYELILRREFVPCNIARNLGIARVKTKYVVFLENDVMVEPAWLGALLHCAEEEKADFVGPLCLEGEPAEGNVHSLGGMLLIENSNGQTVVRERHHLGPVCLRTAPSISRDCRRIIRKCTALWFAGRFSTGWGFWMNRLSPRTSTLTWRCTNARYAAAASWSLGQ
jgi:hypothetical protein